MTTEKQKEEIRESLERALRAHGYREDRWGNWKNRAGTRRYVIKPNVVRYEAKITSGWVRLLSLPYKQVKVGLKTGAFGPLPEEKTQKEA